MHKYRYKLIDIGRKYNEKGGDHKKICSITFQFLYYSDKKTKRVSYNSTNVSYHQL